MKLPFRQLDEVVAIASHQQTIVFVSELEDGRIDGLLCEHIAEAQDFVVEFSEQVGEILRDVVVEQELHR